MLGPHVSRLGVGVEEARTQHVLENRFVMRLGGDGLVRSVEEKTRKLVVLGKITVFGSYEKRVKYLCLEGVRNMDDISDVMILGFRAHTRYTSKFGSFFSVERLLQRTFILRYNRVVRTPYLPE